VRARAHVNTSRRRCERAINRRIDGRSGGPIGRLDRSSWRELLAGSQRDAKASANGGPLCSHCLRQTNANIVHRKRVVCLLAEATDDCDKQHGFAAAAAAAAATAATVRRKQHLLHNDEPAATRPALTPATRWAARRKCAGLAPASERARQLARLRSSALGGPHAERATSKPSCRPDASSSSSSLQPPPRPTNQIKLGHNGLWLARPASRKLARSTLRRLQATQTNLKLELEPALSQCGISLMPAARPPSGATP